MHDRILDKINNELKKGNKVAFATLTEVKGSSPGKAGATLAYFNDKSIMGTVGGGILEHEVITKCAICLESGQDSLFTHSLNENSEDTSMQCGGSVSGYIKVFKPRPRLLIVGGGHVGFNIYNVSRSLDFYTIVVDDRQEFGNKQRFELADEVYFGNISKILNELRIDENTYVVIATRGYEKDLEALREIIKEDPSYIGMIGSSKKWETLKTQLIKEGIKEDKLNNVYAPVGLNICSNEVNEIAFAIMAELLLVKNNGHLSHRKNKNLRIDN
ncbi:XdhC/CoxI family protein [Romboutsia sp.]|uniref:XdhC family protein n=1 Tax=Romboutsia sp. TaxID=1965302 RepID=UPI002C581EF4|nr:XdhC/CoxI family protein [Romboutsia sp.]HSQ89932.1 XdhC/CoxI family protein [Romboutsia sp.]